MSDIAAPATSLAPSRGWLERLWSGIADRGRAYADVPSEALPPLDRARRLAGTMLSERGEASGAAVARELLESLRALSGEDRVAFFRFLSEGFGPDPERLRQAVEAWIAEPGNLRATELADAAEAPRQELLRRMNMGPGGTTTLVKLREELLGHLKAEPVLRVLDSDLRHLFASWFNRGFLELRRIDWQTPAAVLEKLIAYEAVHEIQGWDDLRRRLDDDRRCFAFFHPALPGEPLIFVEVALTEGLAAAVQPLLSRDEKGDPARADTAIFYSISNCQEGLRGISFGNFLIKQVVEELKAELPQIRRFATLSPVPGFRRWLDRQLAEGSPFRPEEEAALTAASGADDAAGALAALTAEGWWQDEAKREALRDPLLRLAALYLTRPNAPGAGIDPVARFHLGNGARLERIDWLGNTSGRGLRESYGVMVNYQYDPDTIEANHERFVHSGEVARSSGVEALLRLPRAPASSRSALSRLLGGEEKTGPKPG